MVGQIPRQRFPHAHSHIVFFLCLWTMHSYSLITRARERGVLELFWTNDPTQANTTCKITSFKPLKQSPLISFSQKLTTFHEVQRGERTFSIFEKRQRPTPTRTLMNYLAECNPLTHWPSIESCLLPPYPMHLRAIWKSKICHKVKTKSTKRPFPKCMPDVRHHWALPVHWRWGCVHWGFLALQWNHNDTLFPG